MDRLEIGDKVAYRYADGELTGTIISTTEIKGRKVYRILSKTGEVDYRYEEDIRKL